MQTEIYLCRIDGLYISHATLDKTKAEEWVESDPENRSLEPIQLR